MNRMNAMMVLAAACLMGTSVNAATMGGTTDNATVYANGTVTTQSGTYSQMYIGTNGQGEAAVFVFQLPTLPANTGFASGASLSITINEVYSTPPAADLYGLGYRVSPTVLASDYYAGATPDTTDATLLQTSMLTTSGLSTTSGSLSDYLNAQYTASATARQSGPAYVFLRLSPQSVGLSWDQFEYRVFAANSWGAEPTVTYNTVAVPEPATTSLLLLGLAAGGLSRRNRKSQAK